MQTINSSLEVNRGNARAVGDVRPTGRSYKFSPKYGSRILSGVIELSTLDLSFSDNDMMLVAHAGSCIRTAVTECGDVPTIPVNLVLGSIEVIIDKLARRRLPDRKWDDSDEGLKGLYGMMREQAGEALRTSNEILGDLPIYQAGIERLKQKYRGDEGMELLLAE